jgi:hypothetical protein
MQMCTENWWNCTGREKAKCWEKIRVTVPLLSTTNQTRTELGSNLGLNRKSHSGCIQGLVRTSPQNRDCEVPLSCEDHKTRV